MTTDSQAQGVLTLTCDKCTRYHSFHGNTRDESIGAAVKAGWLEHEGKIICPKCPAPRASKYDAREAHIALDI